MAALSPNRIAWRYTYGTGKYYVVSAQKAITDQAKCGGQAADGTESAPPQGFKFRRVNCQSATGVKRSVIAYTDNALIWTTPGTTINLNYMNDSLQFVAKDSKREQQAPRRAVIGQAT